MEYKDIKIGNVVRVEAKALGRDLDLIGTIKGIYPHHILVVDHLGLWNSIHPSDFKFMHLVEEANFEEYGNEDFYNDVSEALKNSGSDDGKPKR